MQHFDRVSTKLQREGWRLEAPLPWAQRWTSPLGQTLPPSTSTSIMAKGTRPC
jgi:hypothetical protein